MDPLLSKFQCGLWRGFCVQNCILAAKFKRWKLSLDKVKALGALLTDLLKAFDCFSLDLIIAKLNTHGFSPSALKLIKIFLTEKKTKD